MLVDLVNENPGLHFSKILEITGMKNGVLAHYAKKLESDGKLRIHKENNRSYFFSPEISLDFIPIVIYLRKSTPKSILLSLKNENGLNFKKIVKIVGKSPPTVSQNLTKLLKSGLIELKLEDNEKKYFLIKNQLMLDLIKKYSFQ